VRERIGKTEDKRQKRDEVDGEENREKLLDLRVKRKTDKFCWF
jgi:hypothetical protein